MSNAVKADAHPQAEKAKQTYRIMHPSPIKQYLPKEITTVCPLPVRLKSPRMIAPFEMIVFPPRIMFCGPAIIALRDTLFPVSWINRSTRADSVRSCICSDHECRYIRFRYTPRVSNTLGAASLEEPPLAAIRLVRGRAATSRVTWKPNA